jgi:hypothetical protein
LKKGPVALSRRELSLLASDSETLEVMNRIAWSSAPDSYWGGLIEQRIRRE